MEKKSTYKISISENEAIHQIVITGVVTRDDIPELHNDVYNIVKLTNAKKLLCDIRELKGRFGFTDMYFFATNLPSGFLNIYVALVDLPENAHLQSFRQYVAKHTGIPVKWYTDTDEAIFWLKSLSS